MSVSPLENRYGRPVMKEIFQQESRMRYLLRCEGTLAKFQEYMGAVPKGYGLKIYDSALSGKVTLERIAELEKETKHDLMSLVKALSEAVGEPANKYIHLGATSSDILDTSTAIQFKDANDIIEEALDHLASVLRDLTVRSREMICIGRTHGQYAIPTTFGSNPQCGSWRLEGILNG